VNIPIFTFINPSLEDDVSYDGCQYAKQTTDLRHSDDAYYIDWLWIADFARKPLAEALDISDEVMAEADFLGVYHYQDAYVARDFEGLPFAKTDVWNDNTYLEMREL